MISHRKSRCIRVWIWSVQRSGQARISLWLSTLSPRWDNRGLFPSPQIFFLNGRGERGRPRRYKARKVMCDPYMLAVNRACKVRVVKEQISAYTYLRNPRRSLTKTFLTEGLSHENVNPRIRWVIRRSWDIPLKNSSSVSSLQG